MPNALLPARIRAAHASDAPSISTLGAHIFDVTFGHSVPPHELQAYLDDSFSVEAITRELNNSMKETVVATGEDGKIIGFAILTRGTSEPCVADLADKIELQRIYVDPDAHGKGVGGLLAKTVEKLAVDMGFRNIWLGVWEENSKAQKAYQRWGYQLVGQHDFTIGTVIQTDLIMTKRL